MSEDGGAIGRDLRALSEFYTMFSTQTTAPVAHAALMRQATMLAARIPNMPKLTMPDLMYAMRFLSVSEWPRAAIETVTSVLDTNLATTADTTNGKTQSFKNCDGYFTQGLCRRIAGDPSDKMLQLYARYFAYVGVRCGSEKAVHMLLTRFCALTGLDVAGISEEEKLQLSKKFKLALKTAAASVAPPSPMVWSFPTDPLDLVYYNEVFDASGEGSPAHIVFDKNLLSMLHQEIPMRPRPSKVKKKK